MRIPKKCMHMGVNFLMVLMLLTITVFSNVFAAGVETFRLNHNYNVGSFTFTGDNTTPQKTVQGRYLWIYLNMTRSSSDKGIASTPIRVTVKLLDASTLQQIGGEHTYILQPNSYMDGGFETDLGYAGRKILIRFDSYSYNGPTNQYYRTVYVKDFTVNTTNTQGMYFDF